MAYLKKTIFNIDLFRIICLIISIVLIIPYCYNYVNFLKFLHIYAIIIVIFDLFGEKRLLKNKLKFFGYLICISYSFTMIMNKELLTFSHISDFGYFLIQIVLLTSYNSKKESNLFSFLSYMYIAIITILNIIAIFMFKTQYQAYINESFIGMYPHEYRLCGMFGNPAVLSFVTVIAIGLIFIALTYRNSYFNIKNIVLVICFFINYFVLVLSNARTANIALFVMMFVFIFLIVKRNKNLYRAIIISILALLLNFGFFQINKKLGSYMVSSYLATEKLEANMSQEIPLVNEESEATKETENQVSKDTIKNDADLARDDTGLNGRTDLWKSGFSLFCRYPIFGIGLNNVNYKLMNLNSSYIEVSGSLHNSYLEFIVAFGFIGLFIALFAFISVIDNTYRYFKKCKNDPNINTVIGILSLISCLLVIGLADSSLLFSIYPTSIIFCSLISYLFYLYDKAFEANNLLHETFLWAWVRKLFSLDTKDNDICFVIDSLGGGGAEKILTNTVIALSDTHKVTILTLWSEDILEKELDTRVELISVDHFSMKILKRILYWINRHCLPVKAINYLYLDHRYKYCVAFLEGLSTKLVSEVKGKKIKKYTWVHIDLVKENWVLKYFKTLQKQKEVYEKFDQIYCVSKEVRKSFINLFGCENKVQIQLNLVDTRKISALAKEKVLDFHFDKECVYLYSIGRLNYQKGYDRLISIMKKLIDERYFVKLLIVGEGDLHAELEELIRDNKLSESVYLLGFKDNPYKYAKYCDIFVCSSRAEGYSTVITENLVLGKAIISTQCAGVIEQLGNNEYGIVVKNDDMELYKGIKNLLDNKENISFYEAKAYQRGKNFDYLKLKNEYEEIFS